MRDRLDSAVYRFRSPTRRPNSEVTNRSLMSLPMSDSSITLPASDASTTMSASNVSLNREETPDSNRAFIGNG